MIYKVFEDEQLSTGVLEIVNVLAKMPTKGLAYTKKALEASFSNTLDQQLQIEDKLQQLSGATDDFKEGMQAFLEKRKPDFKGK
jgi:2-(1,2-epoxy-1,2-dihydrophenyl)acetyl-CoA isomerase